WDEWVPESRVLKYNDSNVQRQKELQRSHEADPQILHLMFLEGDVDALTPPLKR
ncbi:unnamed protein product, partial [Timema podura]|nr:unnamed protein product [Timema podura]